jgi:hypothetical protein
MGLVQKGEEKEGLQYLMPLLIISLSLFFIIRGVLYNFFAESFSVG